MILKRFKIPGPVLYTFKKYNVYITHAVLAWSMSGVSEQLLSDVCVVDMSTEKFCRDMLQIIFYTSFTLSVRRAMRKPPRMSVRTAGLPCTLRKNSPASPPSPQTSRRFTIRGMLSVVHIQIEKNVCV